MQEILERLCLGPVAELLADEIFDSLDVVVGRRLDFLDPFGVVGRESVDDVIENVLDNGRQWPQFRYRGLVGQALQPANFDEHPKANQAVLAEDVAELVDLARIAAVGR